MKERFWITVKEDDFTKLFTLELITIIKLS